MRRRAAGERNFYIGARARVPRSPEEIFAFFSEAANLEILTPQWLCFEILTPQPIGMVADVEIDCQLRWHGIPMRWKTKIARWEPPWLFEDLQKKGPYQLWRHTHRFQAADGGTLIHDRVQYALPFGWVGRVVHAVSVRRNIEEIFDYRHKKIEALFGKRREKSSADTH